ncbi:hypothetical protein HDV02_004676 [Globomyces sp. JEL0801]|nr:hypothetical protein HDV02_004676 [Globomyces sp. JEL0801]
MRIFTILWTGVVMALSFDKYDNEQVSHKTIQDDHGEIWDYYTHKAFPNHTVRAKPHRQLCDTSISGYIDIEDRHLFFWFFESRSKPQSDPLVLWLNGGPGSSSMAGLLKILGPCKFDPATNRTNPHPYSWNNNANLLFLDQPVETGFSYTDKTIIGDTESAAGDVYTFLQLFLQSFKIYKDLPFHAMGESYAGHYVPAIGQRILLSNRNLNQGRVYINLVTIAIGNGITNSLIQFNHYGEYGAEKNVYNQSVVDQLNANFPKCKSSMLKCIAATNKTICKETYALCEDPWWNAFDLTGLDVYDVRDKEADVKPFPYKHYLNNPQVQKVIGVARPFKAGSKVVGDAFDNTGDIWIPYHGQVAQLLENNIRVLLYAGDADMICNYLGNKYWALDMEWKGKIGFNSAPDRVWNSKLTGKLAGEYRTYQNLTFLKVFEAGHAVPFNQPEHSLEFFNDWINSK